VFSNYYYLNNNNMVFCPCIDELIDNKGTAMNHPRTIRYTCISQTINICCDTSKNSQRDRDETRMFVYLWLVPPSWTAANITCTHYVSNYKWENKTSFSTSKLQIFRFKPSWEWFTVVLENSGILFIRACNTHISRIIYILLLSCTLCS